MNQSNPHPGVSRRTVVALALSATGALPVHAQANKPIRIGTILSVTGPVAFLGEDMKAGMQMAVDDINASGGIGGRRIEWIFYDAESQTAKAINATRRLLSQDQVDVIVGGGNISGIAMAMAPLAEKAGVPFLSTEGSMQVVMPASERRFVFKATADDDQVIERILDYFVKKKIKKAAMLADSQGFGQNATEQIKRQAPGRGVEMTYETFNPTDTDLTAQLNNIKNSGAQAVICWTSAPSGVVFIKQSQQLGLDKLVRVHSFGFVEQRYMQLAGDSVRGLLLASVKFPVGNDLPESDPVKAPIVELTRRFRDRFGRLPNQFVSQSYDAMMLAKVAFEKAGGDRSKVPEALEQLKGFKGVGGIFNFSAKRHSGLSKDDVVMVAYENGGFVLADYK